MKPPIKQNGPVFSFTVHRSGSTLLGRLLNSHPDLVVWGEHSGIINKLAEIDYAIRYNQEFELRESDDWFQKFTGDVEFRSRKFEPWTAPHLLTGTRASAKQLIQTLFSQHLQPGQRWGFKEIRYHRPYVAEFLVRLFPDAKFVLLQRDAVDAAVSNILSDWSQHAVTEEITVPLANHIVDDVVYALLAFSFGFGKIAGQFPRRCVSLNYNSLRERDAETIRNMFRFLGFDSPPGFEERIRRVFATRTNTTRKKPKTNGILTSDFIRARAAEVQPRLQAEIAEHGVDRARIVAATGPGKYSYLVGGRRSSYLRL